MTSPVAQRELEQQELVRSLCGRIIENITPPTYYACGILSFAGGVLNILGMFAYSRFEGSEPWLPSSTPPDHKKLCAEIATFAPHPREQEYIWLLLMRALMESVGAGVIHAYENAREHLDFE